MGTGCDVLQFKIRYVVGCLGENDLQDRVTSIRIRYTYVLRHQYISGIVFY